MKALTMTPTKDPALARVSPDQDALLQASRRVDWRFLLPDPDLGDTAYIGREEASLLDALRQFSRSLTILELQQSANAKPPQFALVVARNASRGELRQAVDFTGAGGFVYVEVDKRSSQPSGRRPPRNDHSPRGVRGCLSFLQQLDLYDLQVYWHWPDFDACREIIPLRDRAAGLCSLGRRGGNLRARWKQRLGRVLLEAHCLERFVPCFSIVAQRR